MKWPSKPTLEELLKGVQTKDGKKEAILNAVRNGLTQDVKYVRNAIDILEERQDFAGAGFLAEEHGMTDDAIRNLLKAKEYHALSNILFNAGRKKESIQYDILARNFEQAVETAFEIGDKKSAITALENIAFRTEARYFGGNTDFVKTAREKSRKYLEAARIARGAKDRRAESLYLKAIDHKASEFQKLLNDGNIFGTTPGKKVDVTELIAIAREFGDEGKAINAADGYEVAGRLALGLGKIEEAEQLFHKALTEYEEGTFGRRWTTVRLKTVYPKALVLHYEKTGRYHEAARLARKIGDKEQADKYKQLAIAHETA